MSCGIQGLAWNDGSNKELNVSHVRLRRARSASVMVFDHKPPAPAIVFSILVRATCLLPGNGQKSWSHPCPFALSPCSALSLLPGAASSTFSPGSRLVRPESVHSHPLALPARANAVTLSGLQCCSGLSTFAHQCLFLLQQTWWLLKPESGLLTPLLRTFQNKSPS